MKIVRIIYEWPPPWLGLAPAPYELTRAQVKLGNEFEVFCGRWPRAGAMIGVNNVNFHPVYRAPFQGTVGLSSSIAILLRYVTWRKRNRNIDIIHSHGHFGMWIYLYRYCLEKFFPWSAELKTPLVVHFHNTVKGRKDKLEESEIDIKSISRLLDWPLAELSDKFAIKTAAACIFVSEDLKNEAIKYYKADPKKCFVVETGVDPEKFFPVGSEEKTRSRVELGFEPEDKVLLYVGAITERKNIHLLVEALADLPHHYKLILLGEGTEDYIDDIDAILAKKNLKDRVRQVGYTPYPDIPIAYQDADLFVIPSSFEGLPKVVMEALSSGLPVLAAGFSLKDSIEGIEYLDKLTPESIAIQIKEMVENPRKVDVFSVRKNYSWEVKAQEVEQVYDVVKKTYFQ